MEAISSFLDPLIQNFCKLPSERIETPLVKRLSDLTGQIVIEKQIVRHSKAERKHLIGFEEMADIGP